VGDLVIENTCTDGELDCLEPYIDSSAWSPDGTRLLTVGDLEIRLWDATTYELLTTFTEYGIMRGIAWSPNGAQFAIASDNTVKVWDAETGEITFTYTSPNNERMNSVDWSPNGRMLAFGGEGDILEIVPAPTLTTPVES
jgi:WD40 repeat protein